MTDPVELLVVLLAEARRLVDLRREGRAAEASELQRLVEEALAGGDGVAPAARVPLLVERLEREDLDHYVWLIDGLLEGLQRLSGDGTSRLAAATARDLFGELVARIPVGRENYWGLDANSSVEAPASEQPV